MDNENSPPVYVVLGATGGIGSALCKRLSRKGAKIVAGGRDEDKLDGLAGETGAHPIPLDATKTDEVNSLFEKAVEEYGRIDGAANCVGSFMLKPAHRTTDEELSETLALNLNTAFGTIKAAATYLPRELRVNMVAPGLVQTPMTEKITASDASRKASEDLHPMGRLGEPEDIASMIEWLLDPANDWITGQIFSVDGGLSSLHPMPRRQKAGG